MLDWTTLVTLPDQELSRYDIAEVNLACAVGLQGAEAIDEQRCLRTLDRWTGECRRYTEQGWDRFRNEPERYDYSDAKYRIVRLVLGLKSRCGMRYDPAKTAAKPNDPFDFHEEFIHGVLQGPGGTCATIPVVIASVGRRLGYPIRLVHAKCHLFARWDDPATGTRINIEGSNQSLDCHSDEYYRIWPYPVNEDEERHFGYLQSMTPRKELAKFVAIRGYRWHAERNYLRALAALAVAAELDHPHLDYTLSLKRYAEEWNRVLKARRPPGFPNLNITVDQARRRWPMIPWELERKILFLEAAENLLNDPDLVENCWTPLREGRRPLKTLPARIQVNCTRGGPCLILA